MILYFPQPRFSDFMGVVGQLEPCLCHGQQRLVSYAGGKWPGWLKIDRLGCACSAPAAAHKTMEVV